MGYKEPMLNLFTSMTRGVGTMILFVMAALFWLGCKSIQQGDGPQTARGKQESSR